MLTLSYKLGQAEHSKGNTGSGWSASDFQTIQNELQRDTKTDRESEGEYQICISSCKGVRTWWASDWSKIKPHHGWWHKKWVFYSNCRQWNTALGPSSIKGGYSFIPLHRKPGKVYKSQPLLFVSCPPSAFSNILDLWLSVFGENILVVKLNSFLFRWKVFSFLPQQLDMAHERLKQHDITYWKWQTWLWHCNQPQTEWHISKAKIYNISPQILDYYWQ